jgi:hypothetical protein
MGSTYFGVLAEFGEANIPLDKVAPKYFGLSYEEARRRAPSKLLPVGLLSRSDVGHGRLTPGRQAIYVAFLSPRQLKHSPESAEIPH